MQRSIDSISRLLARFSGQVLQLPAVQNILGVVPVTVTSWSAPQAGELRGTVADLMKENAPDRAEFKASG